MADLRAARAARRPVAAREIVGPGERSPIRTRSGEDVVLIRPIAEAIDRITAFGQRRLFADRGPAAMKLLNVHRDEISQGVVPGPRADPIAGVDRRLTSGRGGAEICPPHMVSRPFGIR